MKTLKTNFSLILEFFEEKNYFALLGKKTLFLLFSRQGLVIFPQKCLASTATGTEATFLVSVAVND